MQKYIEMRKGRREGRGGVRGMGRRERREGEIEFKIAFWNVAGLDNKNRDFWKSLEE